MFCYIKIKSYSFKIKIFTLNFSHHTWLSITDWNSFWFSKLIIQVSICNCFFLKSNWDLNDFCSNANISFIITHNKFWAWIWISFQLQQQFWSTFHLKFRFYKFSTFQRNKRTKLNLGTFPPENLIWIIFT